MSLRSDTTCSIGWVAARAILWAIFLSRNHPTPSPGGSVRYPRRTQRQCPSRLTSGLTRTCGVVAGPSGAPAGPRT
jgi:hypothetical protein